MDEENDVLGVLSDILVGLLALSVMGVLLFGVVLIAIRVFLLP